MMRLCVSFLFFFFFSSRRRHTRFDCDWSSDVCSSDLLEYDVEVQHLVKVFDNDVTAVNDVSFKIERGRFFTLLGPSGRGKSTVLRMIGGLERPTRGEVLLGGSRVPHLPPYLRNTSMVFQSLALFPHLDVAGNIAFGLRMRRVPEREITSRVTTALGLVELPGYGARRIWRLGGGERQGG